MFGLLPALPVDGARRRDSRRRRSHSFGEDAGGPPLTARALAAGRVAAPAVLFLAAADSRSVLLDLDGSELLVVAFALAAWRCRAHLDKGVLLAWSMHVVMRAILGPMRLLQWVQLVTALDALRSARLRRDAEARAADAKLRQDEG